MAEQTAKFQFLGYKVVESSIKLNNPSEGENNLSVNFKQATGVDEANKKMKLTLETEIEDQARTVEIKVKTEGYFEFAAEIDEGMKRIFFTQNAPAILFPYIRAYVSTLTALSGIPSIILPTLNLSNRK